MAPSSRNAARRYADKSRRRRPGRITRAVDDPSLIESPASETVAEQGAPASAPVVHHRDGETRITIATRSRSAAATRPPTYETTDYAYVGGDLRRVSIVAGVLIAGLLILSFVIH